MKVFKEINIAARLLYKGTDFERTKYNGVARNKRKYRILKQTHNNFVRIIKCKG